MHVVHIAPNFPFAQPGFCRALRALGCRVTGICDVPWDHLPWDVKQNLTGYEYCPDVKNDDALLQAAQRVHAREPIDRLEATIEFQQIPAAKAREALGIPGTPLDKVIICRDKVPMKEYLRKFGIKCAASSAADSADEVRAFVRQTGYPVLIKPRDSAGADDAVRIDSDERLEQEIRRLRIGEGGRSCMIEEFIEGQEGFYDTLVVGGRIVFEGLSFYYPNVLPAMRAREISPQIVATNRVDAPEYRDIRELGHQVIEALGLEFSATHQEFFITKKGVYFSEIGCRPPGCNWWHIYNWANDMDLFSDWAQGLLTGQASPQPNRSHSAGIVSVRPNQDGTIVGYSGIDEVRRTVGGHLGLVPWAPFYLPDIGQKTSPVAYGFIAHAYVHVRHPDFDECRRLLNYAGETLKIWAQ